MPESLEKSRSDVLLAGATACSPPATRKGPVSAARRAALEQSNRFLQGYYHLVATEDLLAREPAELAAIAMGHQRFAAQRPAGTLNVRVYNPTVPTDGWSSP